MPSARIPSQLGAAWLFVSLAGCTGAPQGRLDVDPHTFRQRIIAESAARGVDVRFGLDAEHREILTLSLARRPAVAWSPSGHRVAVLTAGEVTVIDPTGEAPARAVPLPEGAEGHALRWLVDDRIRVRRADAPPLMIDPEAPAAEPVTGIKGRALAMSDDGQRVVVVRDRSLRLLHRGVDGFSEVPGFAASVHPVALSDRELFIATPSGLRIVDAATGENTGYRSWPPGDDGRPAPATGLAVKDGWVRISAGPHYVFAPFGDDPIRWVVRPAPRWARWCSHGGAPELPLTCLDADGRWWLGRLGGQRTPLPAGLATAVLDPTGRWLLATRHDGIWLHPVEPDASAIGAGRHLGPLPTRSVVAAIEDDGQGTWVLGLEGADRPDLPVLAERSRAIRSEPRDGAPFVGAITRLGATLGDAPTFDAEIAQRMSWSLGVFGGDERAPSRAHRWMLGGQIGVDVRSDGDALSADLRLALPLAWRTRRSARFGGETYVDGWPLSVVLEPGYRVIDGTPDLTLSVASEDWGGGYARVSWDRAGGAPVWGLGLEGGTTPTKWVAVGLLGVAIGVALANADWDVGDGFCHRC